jgi:hypothetical protein
MHMRIFISSQPLSKGIPDKCGIIFMSWLFYPIFISQTSNCISIILDSSFIMEELSIFISKFSPFNITSLLLI